MAPGEAELTAQLIQKYIGTRHEYNAFQYPEALTSHNKDSYTGCWALFIANPKAAPSRSW